jgi:nucleoside 2-deoxyribosyltransferase
MIVYIAGPMTGLPDFNYPAFNAAEEALTRAGFETLNPTLGESAPSETRPWDWYMRRALGQVLEADGIVLLKGWDGSRGATLEHHVGTALGLPTGSLFEWLSGGVA